MKHLRNKAGLIWVPLLFSGICFLGFHCFTPSDIPEPDLLPTQSSNQTFSTAQSHASKTNSSSDTSTLTQSTHSSDSSESSTTHSTLSFSSQHSTSSTGTIEENYDDFMGAWENPANPYIQKIIIHADGTADYESTMVGNATTTWVGKGEDIQLNLPFGLAMALGKTYITLESIFGDYILVKEYAWGYSPVE